MKGTTIKSNTRSYPNGSTDATIAPMQVATSTYHATNHNLVFTARNLF